MTGRERVLCALNFQEPDRVPFNFWMDRRLLAQYEQKYGVYFRVEHYDGDVIETFPFAAWPCGPTKESEGSLWVTEPLLKDWSKVNELVLPSVETSPNLFDMTDDALAKHPDKAILVNICGPTTILHNVRLLDNIYYDFYDYPDELLELCKRVMAIQTEIIREAVKKDITGIYFQEDICSSAGPMFSSQILETYIFDLMKEGIEIAKNAGTKVLYHSDGNVTAVLDRLCELGFDAVNPMQIEFNDFKAFKAKFDGRMAVYGGIDNTKIIPNGTVEEVRAHIRYIYDTLGRGGGLIMSSHDINVDCPECNIDAMVDEIKRCGAKS